MAVNAGNPLRSCSDALDPAWLHSELDQAAAAKMKTNTLPVQLMRWGLSATLSAAGVYALNLACFHDWASGFRNGNADWHRHWSNIFLGCSFLAFLAAGFCLWKFRSRRPANHD